ncbi:MAG: class I tRNA ligase family protein [Polyangiaceae bacterium]|nr:class I tRNA ligase family protein [Polyangiaceae bacterium]
MSSRAPSFDPVPQELDFPRYERAILEGWRRDGIFEQAMAARGPDAPHFVFYEGPPTANGTPHNGHVLTRVMKDLFPRYKAMCGYRVLRKGGWDTHGLPVEVEVEKELRIHGKAAIVEHGVEPFVRRCIESVFRYTDAWERLTERIAFWVSLEDAYVTYHESYVESVWWALSRLFQQGLLYRGHKVVWWWPQGGTALSSAEVGLGYKKVDDPSAFVAFPLVDDPGTALVVWTTTPWTLPSNAYAAVRPGTDYVVARVGVAPGGEAPSRPPEGQRLIVAAPLREALEAKLGRPLEVERTLRAEALAGARYRPPYDAFTREHWAATRPLRGGGEAPLFWRVIVEDFVTLDTGTGIVHVAPAFGEDDHQAHLRQWSRYDAGAEAPVLFGAVHPDGTFRDEVGPRWAGRNVKACDREILRDLSERGLLVHEETYRHDYPFCWRADEDPLLQMARPAWFIRTTARIDRARENNQVVQWLPEHIRDGRFGDFLANNVDWALSRERFWGTPLNIWQCRGDGSTAEGCGHEIAPSSVAELERRNPDAFAKWRRDKAADPTLSDHLRVHKPWIDEVTLPCERCGGTMRRVPEVIDCWFDSGCMPFAQWGFPHRAGSVERFRDAFPADFISEAIDQTRGWFYSLLMISSLVFDEETQREVGLEPVRPLPHPYRTCIVLGHVGDKEGKKESKSRGNYTPPELILDRVRMEFAVVSEAPNVTAEAGSVRIAREDLEGMDVADGAALTVTGANGARLALTVRGDKRLPRRVALLAPSDREALGAVPAAAGLEVRPVEVPRLDAAARVWLEDESTPAPGADAFRWFFYASSPPWSNTRHSLGNVRTLQKDFLVKLRNVYSFFVIYANIDSWSPSAPEHQGRPRAERALLDRWLLGEVALTTRDVRAALDAWLVHDAALRLLDLVESLSNWWVRRSRARFWGPGMPPDKLDALATLHEALVTLAKLAAPFVPFFAEELYQSLVRRPGVAGARASVHLEDYPSPDAAAIDESLAADMRAVREVVSLGLAVRTREKLRVRQPLARADVVLNAGVALERLQGHEALVAEELNVHEVRLMAGRHESGAVGFKLKVNFRALGPRLGKQVQAAKSALERADAGAVHAELQARGRIALDLGGEVVELERADVDVQVTAEAGFAAETGGVGVVVLHTTLTQALLDEGLFRELASRVQAARKDAGLEFTDRIVLTLGGSERLLRVARAGEGALREECLAVEVRTRELAEGEGEELSGERCVVGVERA